MKKHKQLAKGLLVVALAGYAIYTTVCSNRLQRRLDSLEASHQQLQEKHQLLKDTYLHSFGTPIANEEAFRKVLAALEKKGGMDLPNMTSPESTVRVNLAPRIQSK